jgi:hypothetical protein
MPAGLLPEMSARLDRIAAFAGTEHELFAVRQAYALMPRANFSRAILEPCPDFTLVSELPPMLWSDLGTPRRVFDLLGEIKLSPAWLREAMPA